MKETKRYNPNSFNAAHAAAAYLAFWLMMFVSAFALSAVLNSQGEGKVSDYSPYLVMESVLIAAGLGIITLIVCLSPMSERSTAEDFSSGRAAAWKY